MPNLAMSTPARAGPVLRAALKTTALRPMALVRLLGGTASEIRAARAGCRKVWTTAIKTAVT